MSPRTPPVETPDDVRALLDALPRCDCGELADRQIDQCDADQAFVCHQCFPSARRKVPWAAPAARLATPPAPAATPAPDVAGLDDLAADAIVHIDDIFDIDVSGADIVAALRPLLRRVHDRARVLGVVQAAGEVAAERTRADQAEAALARVVEAVRQRARHLDACLCDRCDEARGVLAAALEAASPPSRSGGA